MSLEISKMVNLGVLRIVPQYTESGLVSKMFLIPKGDGSNRPIFDLRKLNEYLCPKKFNLISHFIIPDLIQKKDFMVKIDLSQAYFHVPVTEHHQRYLAIYYQNQLYNMICLPFGLSTAPIAFARISNWIAGQLRQKNMRVVVYLDDFLLVNQDAQCFKNEAISALMFLTNLGWKINFGKSVLENVEFLGIGWNTATGKKYIPQKKIESIKKELSGLIRSQMWSWHQAMSVLGSLNFMAFVVPLGRLRCRQLQISGKSLPEHSPKLKFQIP